MKKIHFVLVLVLGAFFSLLIIENALSFNTPLILNPPAYFDTNIKFNCVDGNWFFLFAGGNGDRMVNVSDCMNARRDGISVGATPEETPFFHVVYFCELSGDPPNNFPLTLSECKSLGNFLASDQFVAYTLGAPMKGIAILGGIAPSIGSPYDVETFNYGLTSAVGNTMNGIAPLLAVVVGIFMAMLIIAKIIGLYKETGTKETDNVIVKHATSSERRGRGFWIFDDN